MVTEVRKTLLRRAARAFDTPYLKAFGPSLFSTLFGFVPTSRAGGGDWNVSANSGPPC